MNALIKTWAPVAGYEGKYELSNFGAIRNRSGKILVQKRHNGYAHISLWSPEKTFLVHRLVASAFVPNPSNKPVVNHLDCDPFNNRADNLEWSTHKENIHHSARLGRSKFGASRALSFEQASEIRALHAIDGVTRAVLAHRYSVSKSTIGKILSGALYRADFANRNYFDLAVP